jgi:hypothetical protein
VAIDLIRRRKVGAIFLAEPPLPRGESIRWCKASSPRILGIERSGSLSDCKSTELPSGFRQLTLRPPLKRELRGGRIILLIQQISLKSEISLRR